MCCVVEVVDAVHDDAGAAAIVKCLQAQDCEFPPFHFYQFRNLILCECVRSCCGKTLFDMLWLGA